MLTEHDEPMPHLADNQAPERIWAYTGSVMNGIASWEWGLAYRTDDMEYDWPDPAEYVRADIVEALRADLARAVEALEECQRDLDRYSQMEYSSDHPVHVRNRQRDYDGNPARIALASIKERDNG